MSMYNVMKKSNVMSLCMHKSPLSGYPRKTTNYQHHKKMKSKAMFLTLIKQWKFKYSPILTTFDWTLDSIKLVKSVKMYPVKIHLGFMTGTSQSSITVCLVQTLSSAVHSIISWKIVYFTNCFWHFEISLKFSFKKNQAHFRNTVCVVANIHQSVESLHGHIEANRTH